MSCAPFTLWTNTADGATSSGKDKWILDEDAARIVKRVFDLCIDGKGPEQISRILERDHVEIPTLAEPMIADSTLGRKKNGVTLTVTPFSALTAGLIVPYDG